MRSTSLGTSAGKALAAERLAFDHRANLIAVDVEVADTCVLLDEVARGVDATLKTERKPISRCVDLLVRSSADVQCIAGAVPI